MSEVADLVCRKLDELGVAYRMISHPPLFHMEECAAAGERLGAMVCKNYFLTTKNHKVHCLCVVRPEARLRTADISKQAGTARLSFAGEDELERLLRAKPGSVSPLGLLFDEECQVRLLIDSALLAETELAFHPCDNTRTLVIATADLLERFLPAVGHGFSPVEIHDFDEIQPFL